MLMTKDLAGASATPMILAILSKGDSYGYAIIKRVQEVSQNQIAWTDGMLYPVLHRLEEGGFITSAWQVAEGNRKRKYYHITEAGRAECKQLKMQWDVVHHALNTLLDSEEQHD